MKSADKYVPFLSKEESEMAIKHLSPRPKKEIVKSLEEGMLDMQLIEVIKKNNLAYQFVENFINKGKDKLPDKIDWLNGLCEIIRELKGK